MRYEYATLPGISCYDHIDCYSPLLLYATLECLMSQNVDCATLRF